MLITPKVTTIPSGTFPVDEGHGWSSHLIPHLKPLLKCAGRVQTRKKASLCLILTEHNLIFFIYECYVYVRVCDLYVCVTCMQRSEDKF